MNQHLEKLNDVHPMLRAPVLALLDSCEKQFGRKLLIVHGWRSMLEQHTLYSKGRSYDSQTGLWSLVDIKAIVTNTRCGAHNVITRGGEAASMAVDLIPFKADGTLDWEISYEEFWLRLYPLAWKVGLDPLGDKVGSYLKNDNGHFEEPVWKLKLEGLGLLLPTPEAA